MFWSSQVDAIVADPNGVPTVEEIRKLERTRLCLAEGMRMYPAPPILIRRALEDVTLPAGGMGREITLKKGTDCFIAVCGTCTDHRTCGMNRTNSTR